MARRSDLPTSDPIQALHSLGLRACPPWAQAGHGEARRVGASVAGMVAFLERHGARHARLRAWAHAGIFACGEDAAVILDGDTAHACLRSLREAARLSATSPAAFGSFAMMGSAGHVEITQCHDGSRAFLHLERPEGLLRDPLLEAVVAADADALCDLHGPSIAPEELLALRRAGRWADMPNLLVRHCDIALLSVHRRLATAGQLLGLLHQALTQALRGGRWRVALEPMAECMRYCESQPTDASAAPGSPGGDATEGARAVRAVLDACWLAASPSTRQCLRAASRGGVPLHRLDPIG